MPSSSGRVRPKRFVVVGAGGGDPRVMASEDPQREIEARVTRRWDSTDGLFRRFPNIRVFVEDESIYNRAPSIWYSPDPGKGWPLCGTVVFSKLNMYSWGSLTKREVEFLLSALRPDKDGVIRISYDM